MKKRNNHKDILKVAISLFANKGYNGTSIRDIAKEANISLPSLYYHYGNKEGLMVEVLKESSNLLFSMISEAQSLDLPPLERFKQIIKNHLRLWTDYKNESRIFFIGADLPSKESKDIDLQIQKQVLTIYKNELKLLQEAGYLHNKNLTILSFNILSVINWFVYWYREDGKLSIDEIYNEIITFILYGTIGS